MSWLTDAKAEWDKLPGGGKVAVAGIGLLTVGIAGYEWYINRNASATASSQAGVPSTDPNAPGTGVGGLSALDTQSLANMIAGLVNTQGQVGAPGPTGPTGPPGPTTHVPVPPPPIHGKPIVNPVNPHPLTRYTVVSGDNLSAIANRLHVSGGWQTLYNANKSVVGSNPNLIYPGQVLTIPK